MSEATESLIKRRDIAFCTLHPDREQAHTAAAVLEPVAGVLQLEVATAALLRVEYHLLRITLADIEDLLEARGFHLDNGLLVKLKRALYHYTEETQRTNLGCAKGESNCTQKVFATSYKRRDHGCRDDRPDHWRRYL
jgi:hypothetical protein